MQVNTDPDTQVQAFINFLQFEKRYSAHTVLAYSKDLETFFAYLYKTYGQVKPAGITHSFVRSWLAEGKQTLNWDSRTINRKISTLKSYFKYLLMQGHIQQSPMAKVIAPKTAKKLPSFLKETEATQLLRHVDTATESWKTLNAKLLVTLFYATGMRLSELINLQESQVDNSRSQLKVLGKGNKERIIPVTKEIITMLDEYYRLKRKEFARYDTTVLVTEKGKKLYPKYAYLMVTHYIGQASTLDKKSPHVLRHTFATHLLNNGAELNAVKELLGHSSLAATQVYTHNTIDKLKDVYKKAHPKA